MADQDERVSGIHRRRLLGALAAVPLAGVAGSRLARVMPKAWSRPAAQGSSATRCAACGVAGHTMLDAACPAAPRGIA